MCVCVDTDAEAMKAMLHGDKPLLLEGLVRFFMECDEALAMQGDDFLNPLYAHSRVRFRIEQPEPFLT